MNVIEAIYTRRAARSYTPERVDDKTIDTVLRAAVQAPSAMNRQPWLFAVVQNAARLKHYSDRAKAMLLEQMAGNPKALQYEALLKEPGFNIFYDAGTLVVIGTGERGTYTEADCWLAAQNLMLAARDAEIASCCIGFAVSVLNTPEVMAELGFPAEGAAVAPIILGHPTAWPDAVPRNPPKISSWSR